MQFLKGGRLKLNDEAKKHKYLIDNNGLFNHFNDGGNNYFILYKKKLKIPWSIISAIAAVCACVVGIIMLLSSK